jgi:phosphoglycolate phosphatase
MINTVVFDFDGTLADTFNLSLNLINSVAHNYGLKPFSAADIERFRSQSTKDIFKELHIPLHKAPFFIAEITDLLRHQIDNVKPISGMPAVLQQLKHLNFNLDIITSNTIDTVSIFLKKYHLELFNHLYSDKSLFGKHIVIKKYLKKHSLSPNEVIYVGDEIRDIEAAHAAGLKIISVSWGFNSPAGLQAHQPDHLIDTPAQLLPLLASLG